MEKETYSRRSFLNKLWIALGALAFAELVAVLISFFKPRKEEPTAAERDAIIIAGPADSFEPGTVSAFVQGKFYLARLDNAAENGWIVVDMARDWEVIFP